MNVSSDMRRACSGHLSRGGFASLAEVLATLIIGAMILISALGIYNRVERAAAAVNRRLDSSRLPAEVLQRIAEDLDKSISPGSAARISIANKYDDGFRTARLTITRKIVDSKNKEQTLEEIIWQSGYDIESDTEGMVLYRGHSGITLEDKLLDDQRASWEKGYPLVPVCSGVTHFEILVPQKDDKFLDRWTSESLPKGIAVTISFAEAVETPLGTYEIPEESMMTRTLAVDRTRKISFVIKPKEGQEGQANETRPRQL